MCATNDIYARFEKTFSPRPTQSETEEKKLRKPVCFGLPTFPKIIVDVSVKVKSNRMTPKAQELDAPVCLGLPFMKNLEPVKVKKDFDPVIAPPARLSKDNSASRTPSRLPSPTLNNMDGDLEKELEHFEKEFVKLMSQPPSLDNSPALGPMSSPSDMMNVPDCFTPIQSLPTSAECSDEDSPRSEPETYTPPSKRKGASLKAKSTSNMMCKKFISGKCDKKECEFSHDVSTFKPDEQKCFIAGIPQGISSERFIKELRTQGYKVINEPKIHPRGFCPKVTLSSVEKCQELIKKEKVLICGTKCTVRTYSDNHKKGNDRDARSVFVGGLKNKTTGLELMQAVEALGFECEEKPAVTNAYCQRMVLKTVDMCKAIRVLGQIVVNGRAASVREYKPSHKSAHKRSGSPNRRNNTGRFQKTTRTNREQKKYVKKTNNTSFKIKGRNVSPMRWAKKAVSA